MSTDPSHNPNYKLSLMNKNQLAEDQPGPALPMHTAYQANSDQSDFDVTLDEDLLARQMDDFIISQNQSTPEPTLTSTSALEDTSQISPPSPTLGEVHDEDPFQSEVLDEDPAPDVEDQATMSVKIVQCPACKLHYLEDVFPDHDCVGQRPQEEEGQAEPEKTKTVCSYCSENFHTSYQLRCHISNFHKILVTQDLDESITEHGSAVNYQHNDDYDGDSLSSLEILSDEDEEDGETGSTRHLPFQEDDKTPRGDLDAVSSKTRELQTKESANTPTSTENISKEKVSSLARHLPGHANKDNNSSVTPVDKTAHPAPRPAKQLLPVVTALLKSTFSPTIQFSIKNFEEKTKPVVEASFRQGSVTPQARQLPPRITETIAMSTGSIGKKTMPLLASEHAKQVDKNPKPASQDDLKRVDDSSTPHPSNSFRSHPKDQSASEEKGLPQVILDQLATIQSRDIVQCFLCPSKLMGYLGYVAHLAVKHHLKTETNTSQFEAKTTSKCSFKCFFCPNVILDSMSKSIQHFKDHHAKEKREVFEPIENYCQKGFTEDEMEIIPFDTLNFRDQIRKARQDSGSTKEVKTSQDSSCSSRNKIHCQHCSNRIFPNHLALKLHNRRFHPDPKDKCFQIFKCAYCVQFRFNSSQALKQHYLKRHSMNVRLVGTDFNLDDNNDRASVSQQFLDNPQDDIPEETQVVVVQEDRPKTSLNFCNIIPPVTLKRSFKIPPVSLKGPSRSLNPTTFHLEKSGKFKAVLLSKEQSLATADNKVSKDESDWMIRPNITTSSKDSVTGSCLVTDQRKQLVPVYHLNSSSSSCRQVQTIPNSSRSISLVEPRFEKAHVLTPRHPIESRIQTQSPKGSTPVQHQLTKMRPVSSQNQNPPQRPSQSPIVVPANPRLSNPSDSKISSTSSFLTSGPGTVKVFASPHQSLTSTQLSKLHPVPRGQLRFPPCPFQTSQEKPILHPAETFNAKIPQDNLKCGYCDGLTFQNWDMAHKHFYEFHFTKEGSSFTVQGQTVRVMQTKRNLSGPNTLEPVIGEVFSIRPTPVEDQVQDISTLPDIKQEPGSDEVQDTTKPKIEQVFSVRKKLLQDPKSSRVIVKNISTSEGQSFMENLAQQGHLKCGYCSGVNFSNIAHIKAHVKKKHAGANYTGFVIENNLVKLIAAFNKIKENVASPTSTTAEPENPCSTPDPLEIQDAESEQNLARKELEMSLLRNLDPIPQASPKVDCPKLKTTRKLDDYSKLRKLLPSHELLFCIYCPLKVFRSWSTLKNHIYMAHISSSYRVLGLPESQWEMDFKKDLFEKNLEPVLSFDTSDRVDGFQCLYCQVVYKNTNGLMGHVMRRHKSKLEKSQQKFLVSYLKEAGGSEPSSSFKILCEYCPDDNEGFLPDELKQHIAQLHPEFDFQPSDDVDGDITELVDDQSTFGSDEETEGDELEEEKSPKVRCSYCPKKFFNDWNGLKIHIFKEHLGVEDVEVTQADMETNSSIFDDSNQTEQISASPPEKDEYTKDKTNAGPNASDPDKDPKTGDTDPKFNASNPDEKIPIKQEVDEICSESKKAVTMQEPVKTSFTQPASENLIKEFGSVLLKDSTENPQFRKSDETGIGLVNPDETGVVEKPKRKLESHVLQSKRLISKAGLLEVFVEESEQQEQSDNARKDGFNISNDRFYTVRKKTTFNILAPSVDKHLQHALATVFPTHLDIPDLRRFHRPPLKQIVQQPTSETDIFHPIQSVEKYSMERKKAKALEFEDIIGEEQLAESGLFFMTTAQDLSGKDGHLVLFEYCEEHPPLLGLVGMASKMFNYSQNSNFKVDYGLTINLASSESPFLGHLRQGEMIQTLENNMYRAPVYKHASPSSDFVVIRDESGYWIREIDDLFVCGQQLPLFQVPKPYARSSITIAKNFLQAFVYRLFWQSTNDPRTLQMDHIKKAFPRLSESSIRKRLKHCSRFNRTGSLANKWVLNDNFRLPTYPEIDEMVNCEEICAYMSMLANEQRLTDSGYTINKVLNGKNDDEEDDSAEVSKMEDELKCAHWQTTKAFLQFTRGKSLLTLTGPSDPTGKARQGFAFEYMCNRPSAVDDQNLPDHPNKIIKGTDADLRKFSMKEALALLKRQGFPKSDIENLTRWAVIDLIRTLSAEKRRAGELDEELVKYERLNPYSSYEYHQKFRRDCQRLFQLQNKVLSTDDVIDSDEDETSLEGDNSNSKKIEDEKIQEPSDKYSEKCGNFLRITRILEDDSGNLVRRIEILKNPQVIEAYLRINEKANPEAIKKLRDKLSPEEIAAMKKEKRRKQERMRRQKRNEAREKASKPPKPEIEIICGACNAKGHMKTNKICPLFNLDQSQNLEMEPDNPEEHKQKKARANYGISTHCDYLTNSNYKQAKRRRVDPLVSLATVLEKIMSDLVKLEEAAEFWIPVNTRKVPDYLDKVARAIDLQVIKDNVKNIKYHSKQDFLADIKQIVENCSIYNGNDHPLTVLANKVFHLVLGKLDEQEEVMIKIEKAINPLIDDQDQAEFSFILESILDEKLKTMPESAGFLKPVNRRHCKDYYDLIKQPMDLGTITSKVAQHKYHSCSDFLNDIQLIHKNSAKYNGEESKLTVQAKKLVETAEEMLDECAYRLEGLEEKLKEALKQAFFEENENHPSPVKKSGQVSPTTVKRKRGRPLKVPLDGQSGPPAVKKRKNSVKADLDIQDAQEGSSKILTLKIEPDQIISSNDTEKLHDIVETTKVPTHSISNSKSASKKMPSKVTVPNDSVPKDSVQNNSTPKASKPDLANPKLANSNLANPKPDSLRLANFKIENTTPMKGSKESHVKDPNPAPMPGKKRQHSAMSENSTSDQMPVDVVVEDYLSNFKHKTSKRRRTDPLVALTTFFEKLMSEIRAIKDSDIFWQPVKHSLVPGYLDVVKRPMDLGTIQTNLESNYYQSRSKFMLDIQQIFENSRLFNGDDHALTQMASRIKTFVQERFDQNSEILGRWEREINPLLIQNEESLTREESLKALAQILQKIVDDKLSVPKDFWPFLRPVTKFKSYREVVKVPMDLETLSNNIALFKFKDRNEFLEDVKLIYTNSALFNGEDSEYTVSAKSLFQTAQEGLQQQTELLSKIENNLKRKPESLQTQQSAEKSRNNFPSNSSSAKRQTQKSAKMTSESSTDETATSSHRKARVHKCKICSVELSSRRKLQQHRYHLHKAIKNTVCNTETKVEQSQNATAFSDNTAPYNMGFVVKEEVLSDDETGNFVSDQLLQCSFCPDYINLSTWEDLENHIQFAHPEHCQEEQQLVISEAWTETNQDHDIEDPDYGTENPDPDLVTQDFFAENDDLESEES